MNYRTHANLLLEQLAERAVLALIVDVKPQGAVDVDALITRAAGALRQAVEQEIEAIRSELVGQETR